MDQENTIATARSQQSPGNRFSQSRAEKARELVRGRNTETVLRTAPASGLAAAEPRQWDSFIAEKLGCC